MIAISSRSQLVIVNSSRASSRRGTMCMHETGHMAIASSRSSSLSAHCVVTRARPCVCSTSNVAGACVAHKVQPMQEHSSTKMASARGSPAHADLGFPSKPPYPPLLSCFRAVTYATRKLLSRRSGSASFNRAAMADASSPATSGCTSFCRVLYFFLISSDDASSSTLNSSNRSDGACADSAEEATESSSSMASTPGMDRSNDGSRGTCTISLEARPDATEPRHTLLTGRTPPHLPTPATKDPPT
mmetsp:Transcript_8614/g.19597  ORF Transcript_8614/g.19597 Transcript_8614/m.19597 type:complete len:245 (+) Transcript_8614:350-1084(+)